MTEQKTKHGNRLFAALPGLTLGLTLCLVSLGCASAGAPSPAAPRTSATTADAGGGEPGNKSTSVERAENGTAATASQGATAAETEAVINRAFNSRVEVEGERRPFYLSGDFNGDGWQDIAVVVRLKDDAEQLKMTKTASVLDPWLAAAAGADGEEASEGGLQTDEPGASAGDLALAVIHGTKDGWKASAPESRYLLLNSVFDELRIHRGKIEVGASGGTPPVVKGDAIYTGSEVASGIIYWDGAAYRWYQQGD